MLSSQAELIAKIAELADEFSEVALDNRRKLNDRVKASNVALRASKLLLELKPVSNSRCLFEDFLITVPNEVLKVECFTMYIDFCKRNGMAEPLKKAFYRELEDNYGFKSVRKTKGRYFIAPKSINFQESERLTLIDFSARVKKQQLKDAAAASVDIEDVIEG